MTGVGVRSASPSATDRSQAGVESVLPERRAPLAPPPAPARGFGERPPPRGDAGRRETTCWKISRFPGVPGTRSRRRRTRIPVHVTASSTAPATRLASSIGTPPRAGVGRRSTRARRPLVRLVVGGPAEALAMSQVPGCGASRPDRDTLRRRRRPGRWRNRAIDAGAVSSPQAHRPGPPTGLPRGGRVTGFSQKIGILSRFLGRGRTGPHSALPVSAVLAHRDRAGGHMLSALLTGKCRPP